MPVILGILKAFNCLECGCFLQVLEPSFNCKLPEIGNSLCVLLKMVFEAFPVDAPDTHQDVKPLHQKVEELIQKQLTTVTANQTQPPLEPSVLNVLISFTLNILKTLVAGNKQYVDKLMMYLVRVFQRLAREMATASTQIVRQVGIFKCSSGQQILIQLQQFMKNAVLFLCGNECTWI